MAIGVHTIATANNASTVVTTAIVTTSGRALIATAAISGEDFHATTPIQDSKGNTWVQVGSSQQMANGNWCRCYKAVNITGGSGHTVTVNSDLGGSYFILHVCEISDVAAAPTVTGTGAIDATSPFDSGSIAPGAACVLVGNFFSNLLTGTESDVWGGSFASGDLIEQITDSDNFLCGSMAAVVKGSGGTYNSSVTSAGVTEGGVFITAVETTTGAASNAPRAMNLRQLMGA